MTAPTAKSAPIDWSVIDTLAPLPAPAARTRKGASRIADIPPDVRQSLSAGETETITLVEWLAIDLAQLATVALHGAELEHEAPLVRDAVLARAELPFTARLKGVGADLFAVLSRTPTHERALVALAMSPSDMVRSWVAMAHGCDPAPLLPARLRTARRFAADRAMSTRECAWDALRPHLVRELPESLVLLREWTLDADANVRRCAIEATRPRGVWCAHIPALRADPSPALPLLEAVRSDPSRYVQASAANWLNDASKDHPAWVQDVCRRWLRESPTPQTRWLVARATRTIRKKAEQPSPTSKPNATLKPKPRSAPSRRNKR